MLLLVTFLLIIILFSRLTEELTRIPSTLAVIVYAFGMSLIFPEFFSISNEDFDEILYLMLPVILLPDILNISIRELRAHVKEIFYLAFISVIASIVLATFITPYLLPQYSFTIGMLIALFSMLMATDAITVSAIMSKFKLPEQLKVYAESESLFNDVTALIIFYFIALPLISAQELSLVSINYILLKVLILSTTIGIVVAYIGFLSIKILKNPFDQFIIIYLVVIVSFLLAEHFHIAGILSIVASTLSFKFLVQRETKNESQRRKDKSLILALKDEGYSFMELIKSVPAITKREFREYKKEAIYLGIFANAVVFVIIAYIIDFHILLEYYFEILIVFFLTSLIRFMSMSVLIVSMKLPFRWAKTLTLSGAKGALAIIMVHSLPESFIYKELFNALVIGNVLISTFLYTFMLMWHIDANQEAYEQDIQASRDGGENHMVEYTKRLVDVLEKDQLTQAYNRAFIEDILSRELARSSRYKLELSLMILSVKQKEDAEYESTLAQMGEIIQNNIRLNDAFGKLSEQEYLIITSNTSLSGAVILAEKLSHKFLMNEQIKHGMHYSFGVTQADETDDLKALFEKLHDALMRNVENKAHQIEIEV